ncbi:MAG: hypothetical protein IBX43_05125 [Campylobacterales bacterium]|nr:hypothetical protein [Campylobacterales bacterium]
MAEQSRFYGVSNYAMDPKAYQHTTVEEMRDIAGGLIGIIRNSHILVSVDFKTGGPIKEADIHVTFFSLEENKNCEIAFYSYKTMEDNMSIFHKVTNLLIGKAEYARFKELAVSL